MKKTIFAGITPDDELYFLEIETQSKEHEYFAMGGFTVQPMLYSTAVEQSRERLEDGELWRMAVEAENTQMGMNDWIDSVLSIDGEMSMIDNSLYPEEMEIDGNDYIFESGSCGQHEEKELKNYAMDEKLFKILMKIWKKYHLKKDELEKSGSDMAVIAEAKALNQDEKTLVADAVRKIMEV